MCLVESDCFTIAPNLPLSNFPKVNLYVYDGDHSEQAQYDAIVKFWHTLDSVCIIVIDDWNWKTVRTGTTRGLEAVGATVLFQYCSYIATDIEITPTLFMKDDYWNGISIFVVSK